MIIKNRVVYHLLVILIAACVAPVAFGAGAEHLSLQEALQLAYERNPRVAVARQEAEAAKGRWMQVRTLPNPEVEVSSTELSQGIRAGSTVGDDSITVSQEVDVLGKFWLRGRATKAEYQAATYTLAQAWNEIVFNVTRAYNSLLLSTHRVDVAREVLTLTRSFLDQVQLRYNAGEVLRSELLRAQIEATKAENGVLQAEKQVTVDTAELNLLLGREPQAILIPQDDLAYEPKNLDPAQLLRQALERRPDLKAREAEIEAQRKQLQLAIHNILENPTVSAIGTRERHEEGTERVFGLAIRLPIPFWNQNRGAIREARAELTKRQIERETLRRQVGFEVTSAIAEAQLAQRQLVAWNTGVEQANELMRLATQQYREGKINFITYLEHLNTARETKVAYVEALANYRTQLALVDQAVAKTFTPIRQEDHR